MKVKQVVKPAEIAAVVRSLAMRIDADYKGRSPVVIGVLKGSFIFLSDLVRRLKVPVEVDFIRAASYGAGTESSGQVDIRADFEVSVAGRDVILVEDIVDTGLTLKAVLERIGQEKPVSVSVCALLDKPARRRVECVVDYAGITFDSDEFIVGYGLDHAERYRNLKGLYVLAPVGEPPPGTAQKPFTYAGFGVII